MNLQEKLSGLKGLVSHSHSKRRFKGDLTLDMISPPLGDFRHTMHVGRGGDVFGDTSFLSNQGGGGANRSNGETDSLSNPDTKIGAFFSRALRQIRRGSDTRPREAPKDLSPPPPAISPIIKNAISLPRLDIDMPNGCPRARALFPGCHSTPEERKSSYGELTRLNVGDCSLPLLLLNMEGHLLKIKSWVFFHSHSDCFNALDCLSSIKKTPNHILVTCACSWFELWALWELSQADPVWNALTMMS